MDNKKNRVSFITGILKEFSTIFTMIILSISFSGNFIFFLDREILNMSTIFTLGSAGLPYTTIAQSALFAIIMAFVSRFLFSEFFAIKISFLWRYIIFFLITLFTTSIFAIIFNWFPVYNLYAWLYFIAFFLLFFGIAIGFSFLFLRLENKKYNKLLENFKRYNKN